MDWREREKLNKKERKKEKRNEGRKKKRKGEIGFLTGDICRNL